MSNPTPPENNPQGYNPQGHNQPGYHQQPPAGNPQAYNQQGYNEPGYNQPGYNQPGYNQQGAGYPPPAKKQSRALPIIIGIVVGLLAIAGLGWALGLFSSDDEPAPAAETSVEDTGTDATDEPSADETTTDEPATDDADSAASNGPRVADPDEQGNQNNQSGELTDELRDLVESQHRLDPNDPRAIGDLDADVIIELYSDYRCGYCKAFHDEVFPDLAPLFEDGTIRLEYNSMPVLGEPSVLAAQASHAAALQDKFWEFHDLAFAFEREFTEQAMIDLASGIEGIDIAKFEADMTSQETVDYIAAEQQNGKDIGIQGTPSFMIGYSLVPGFIETPQFQALIEHELAR